MAGNSREVGFPKSTGVVSLREQMARRSLRNVRSKGHTYVELREVNKKPIFFCVLCLSPCYSDSVLHDHLRGHLHKEMYEAAKATLLKENPWPFNDGMLFFHISSDECNQLTPSNSNRGQNLILNQSFNENSLAIVTPEGCVGDISNHASTYDLTSEGHLNSVGGDESLSDDEDSYDLIIPDVLHKDIVSDLEVRSVGVGKIAVRCYEKDGVSKGISKIWCEWMGENNSDNEDIIPQHEFAIVVFAFNYDLGRKGLLDDSRYLFSSRHKPTAEENKNAKGKKRRSLSDSEDISESLSNEYVSSGEESLISANYDSKNLLDGYDDNSLQLALLRSKSVRKELRIHQRQASKRVCDICQHKMLPGKDVATLLNMKTGKIVCSSRNMNGAFHVYHISCLIHWVLLCDFEVYTKQLVGPKVKQRRKRKKGTNFKEVEKESRKQICSAFCPECQGTGIIIKADELENPTASLSEMFKYKMKAGDGHRAYMKNPEMLQNSSTGFYFPPQSEETMQENVSSLKMLQFYRAVE